MTTRYGKKRTDLMVPRDVQTEVPKNHFKLTRVGVTGVKKPIIIKREGREIYLSAVLDVFVDLPATQKGSHMSRNVEVINGIVEEGIRGTAHSLEEMSEKIAKLLLKRHEYATFSEVKIRADYFLERYVSDPAKKGMEHYLLIAEARADKVRGTFRKLVGVEVVGMTACPCAMETVRQMLAEQYPQYADCIENMPIITHNQRNRSTLLIEVPEGYKIEANDLIELVESSLSSPTFEVLKRKDEGRVVMQAHQNPKFVEDVVRDILHRVLEDYSYLPDDVVITARSESEESIHKHNAFAERVTTMRELKE